MLACIGMPMFLLVLVLVPSPAFAEGDRCELKAQTVNGETVKVMQASQGCRDAHKLARDRGEIIFFKSADCYCCGSCGINDIVGSVIQVSRFIFGIAGSLALLMIMYGGFQWLTAAGSSERVKKGTETLTHAAVGLAIIFGAWILVNFILIAITGQQAGGVANLMNGEWFKVE